MRVFKPVNPHARASVLLGGGSQVKNRMAQLRRRKQKIMEGKKDGLRDMGKGKNLVELRWELQVKKKRVVGGRLQLL